MVEWPRGLQTHPMDLVIVDDHPAVRAGLRGLIDDEPGLFVAATAATAREGFEAIADARPQVALVPRARRAVGASLEQADLATLGMVAHGVSEEEVAATLGLEPELARARRA